jgi:CubicO group peptidase (beta-lactamase class C family)
LIAVDKGQLELDSEESIREFLPELSNPTILKGYSGEGIEITATATRKITLRMLLSHSAGE